VRWISDAIEAADLSGIVDTNLLLYGANADAPEHEAARDFLVEVGRPAAPWYLTEGIVYEFLRVATHPKVFPAPLVWRQALDFLAPFLAADHVHVLHAADEHWMVLDQVLSTITHPSGNLFFDVRTVVLMREHGIRRIFTTDTDFLQFDGIEVINPLRR
jgi:toxin-antitoxin system PIN domain toxin